MRAALAAALAALLLTGCASLRGGGPPVVELAATPFYPQSEYQCGPAALATLLGASGIGVTPAELQPEVYLPARRGSLQTEMLAATRQRGRIAHVIVPTLDALVQELDAQRPVLVLLNLGVKTWPVWHYAVVIGYEQDRSHLLLRSGTTARERLSLRRFRGAWSRADNWGFVALRPGELPADTDAARYAGAVADFETVDSAGALRAYEAGIARWPAEPLLRLGAANAMLAGGDPRGAERVLVELLELAPREVAARNNYAELLSQRGCRDAARAQIDIALGDAQGTPLAAAVAATAQEIDARAADAAAQCPRY